MKLNRKLVKVALAGALAGSVFAGATCSVSPELVQAVLNAVESQAQTNGFEVSATFSPGSLASHSNSEGDANTNASHN